MFSGTRCPALSDELQKLSESRAAAPKDQCPLGHRGGITRLPKRALWRTDLISYRANMRHPEADLKPHKRANMMHEGRFEA